MARLWTIAPVLVALAGAAAFLVPGSPAPALQPASATPTAAAGSGPTTCAATDVPSRWDLGDAEYEKRVKRWVETCEGAVRENGDDTALRLALARALFFGNRRGESVENLRIAARQGSADALVEIYDFHVSWDRGDGNRAEFVDRTEAGDALKKAAEMGHPRAMHVLAIRYDRGSTIRRDRDQAIYWAQRALRNPDKNTTALDLQIMISRLLSQSDDADKRARGIALLETLNRGDAKAHLAMAIREMDSARARKLLEEGMRSWPGAAAPPLADMMIRGEGGSQDVKRGLSILRGQLSSGVGAIGYALGRYYLEGQVVPRDPQEAAKLMRTEVQWSIDATLQLARIVIDNPTVTVDHAPRFLAQLIDAAEVGEPHAMMTLAMLKLSGAKQFDDKAGGCALLQRLKTDGDGEASERLKACSGN